MEHEPDFKEARTAIKARDRRELLEARLVDLFVAEFGEGNEGTVEDLMSAFLSRVLCEEEVEIALSPTVSDEEIIKILEKLIKALSAG